MSGEAAARRAAREAAIQMLYQCEVGRAGALEAIATYWPARDDAAQGGEGTAPGDAARGREANDDAQQADLAEPHRAFANGLVRGTLGRVAEIDALLASHAQNWRVERMTVLDRLVLRLGVYELLAEPGTPPKVVLNEAIELARRFSGEESVPFVNGVLDAVRKALQDPPRDGGADPGNAP